MKKGVFGWAEEGGSCGFWMDGMGCGAHLRKAVGHDNRWVDGGWVDSVWLGHGRWWVTTGSGDRRTVGGGGMAMAVAHGGAGAGAGS